MLHMNLFERLAKDIDSKSTKFKKMLKDLRDNPLQAKAFDFPISKKLWKPLDKFDLAYAVYTNLKATEDEKKDAIPDMNRALGELNMKFAQWKEFYEYQIEVRRVNELVQELLKKELAAKVAKEAADKVKSKKEEQVET